LQQNAGVAVLVSLLMRNREFHVFHGETLGLGPDEANLEADRNAALFEPAGALQVFAYSVPACVSPDLAESRECHYPQRPDAFCRVFNVVYNHDIVPRMNVRNAAVTLLRLKVAAVVVECTRRFSNVNRKIQ